MSKMHRKSSNLVKIYSFTKDHSIRQIDHRNVSEDEYISKKKVMEEQMLIWAKSIIIVIFRLGLFLPDIAPDIDADDIIEYAKISIYSRYNIRLLKKNQFVITDDTSAKELIELFHYEKQDLNNIYNKKLIYTTKLLFSLGVVFSLLMMYWIVLVVMRSI